MIFFHNKNARRVQPIGVESNSYQTIVWTYDKPEVSFWQRLMRRLNNEYSK